MVCYLTNGQVAPRLHFNYDTAGNQIKRYLNLSSSSAKTTDEENPKDFAKLTDDDLLKFSDDDVLSYYPNPVKEQLYVKWELLNDVKVSQITLFTINGQQVKTMTKLENTNDVVISFSDYPVGTYLVHLQYTDGKQESITILKQ